MLGTSISPRARTISANLETVPLEMPFSPHPPNVLKLRKNETTPSQNTLFQEGGMGGRIMVRVEIVDSNVQKTEEPFEDILSLSARDHLS